MRINEGYLHSFIQPLTFNSHWGEGGMDRFWESVSSTESYGKQICTPLDF